MRLTYQPSSQGVKLAGLRLAAYAQEEKGKEGKCKGNGTASLFRSSGSHNILSISDLRNPLRKRSPPPMRLATSLGPLRHFVLAHPVIR